MGYASGEFSLQIGNRPAQQATAFYDNKLWLIGCGNSDNGDMYWTTLSLVDNNGNAIDIAGGAAAQPSNWTSGAFTPANGGAYTYSGCGAAVAGGALFVFWNQSEQGDFHTGQVFASQYGSGQTQIPAWSSPITLIHANSEISITSNDGGAFASVAATATVDGLILVACQAADSPISLDYILVAAFDPAKIDTENQTWTADWETKITLDDLSTAPQFQGGPLATDFGNAVYMDWFIPSAAGNPPTYSLALFFQLESSSQNWTAAFVSEINGGIDTSSGNLYITSGDNPLDNHAFAAPYVIREPAGRPAMYYMAQGNYDVLTFSTYTQNTVTTPLSFPYGAVFETGAAAGDDGTPPCVAFYIDMASATGTVVNGSPATAFPVYRFLFYGGGDVNCQIIQYGTIQEIPNSSNVKLQSTDIIFARGIFDAPLPYPNLNNDGTSFEDTQYNGGTIVYGATGSSSTTRQVSTSLMFGMQTEGESNDGFGPAWNASFSTGPGQVTSATTQTVLPNSCKIDCLLQMTPTPPQVIPNGQIVGTAININTTAYQFLDADGNMVSDATSGSTALAPKYGSIGASFGDSNGVPFTPYTVIPGDLCSYTPERINARMQQLGYPGDNYFQDEIVANALVLDQTTNQNYLSVYWDEGGGGGSYSFQEISSSFVENSWSYDASEYLGISFGGEIGFFGITTFEDFSAKVLAGASITATTQTTTETDSSWGFSVGDPEVPDQAWGPPVNINNPNRVTAYTVQIYFLPPPAAEPNKWVNEFNQHVKLPIGQSLDVNTAAWRIFCVVTEIVIVGNSALQYLYNPDQPVIVTCP